VSGGPLEERVLALTPTSQDAEITCSILSGAEIACSTFTDLQSLCEDALAHGAGAALITEEVITSPDLPCLTDLLRTQPAWSDLPVLVLTYGGIDSPGAELALQLLGNVTLLERPVRVTTLVSAVRSALAARRRQYEIRAHLQEREAREVELRASREQLRLMVESVKDFALFTMDLDGNVTSWNPGAERVFGFQENEILGKPGALIFTPEDRAAGEDVQEMATAVEAGRATDERWHVRKDGSRFFASGILTPIYDDAGRHHGFTKVARDMTDKKRADDALREADRQKDEFLAMLAHELRNPLAPMLNALHIMNARPGRERGARARQVIERQVRHLARLVDDLLDISRITTGKIELRMAPVELHSVLQRVVDDALPLLDAREQRFSVELSPEPLPLLADVTRLEQLLTNVLNNAAKYTGPGGEITITSAREENWAVVRIRDTGVGIAPELLPQVFNLFQQAERSLARSEGGLGIGLTVVKRLVELHGGEVTASSEGIGRGSEFTIRLPLHHGVGAATQTEASLAPPGRPSVPRRVLVVDDNRDLTESVAELLELSGHTVRTAQSGSGALGVAREFSPDVILLDIGLPDKNGYEVAQELRASELPRPVIVAVSGYGRQEDLDRSQEAGFDHHLVKPVEFDRLLALIEGSSPASMPSTGEKTSA
jgi:PAS domain S-box-containing protein